MKDRVVPGKLGCVIILPVGLGSLDGDFEDRPPMLHFSTLCAAQGPSCHAPHCIAQGWPCTRDSWDSAGALEGTLQSSVVPHVCN